LNLITRLPSLQDLVAKKLDFGEAEERAMDPLRLPRIANVEGSNL
jgi:hypothetical protein